MYKPLFELEDINTSCRIHLTKTLAQNHKVRTIGGPGEETQDRCRGLAFFFAFDPWETCLRCPPGSARFFDVAENQGLLSRDEASDLSRALIKHAAEMARIYNGAFSAFFSESRVRTILENREELEHLAESALAVGTSWADRMFETCPFPLQPAKHLEVQSFRQITIEGEIEFYSQTPWLAWVEALDLICLGPWAGLKSHTIINMIRALEQRVAKLQLSDVELHDVVFGRKVILPMFSRGLQGVAVGLFTDVPKSEMEPILTSIIQFGETISDVYADFRWDQFVDALEADLDEDALAREVINVVSPIAKIIVSKEGRRAGYKIGYEHTYLTGYRPLKLAEFNADRIKQGFTVAAPNGAEIYIEPLTDSPHINAEFTKIRLKNYLNQAFGLISSASNGEVLPMSEAQRLLFEYSVYNDDKSASMAKLRQYYVVSKVMQHWQDGGVKITNNELKRFLEDKLGQEIRNGYQVTSFANDFEKIFAGRVTATKTRNALSLSWSKGV